MRALCHGTFDLLHLGHVEMFREAKAMADEVIVTLTSDEFVNKGPGRPIFSEWERFAMIRACRYVDTVEIVRERSGISAIRRYKPDLYVKGADYLVQDKHGALDKERLLVEELGGRLYIAKHAGWSSSKLIERIRGEHAIR
jgi:rfaE bifunctional protein nucleotidyltransferase chain/domain